MVMKKQTLEDKLEAVLDDNVNHPAHYTYGSTIDEEIDALDYRDLSPEEYEEIKRNLKERRREAKYNCKGLVQKLNAVLRQVWLARNTGAGRSSTSAVSDKMLLTIPTPPTAEAANRSLWQRGMADDTFHNLFRCMKDDASIYVFYASTNSTLFFTEYEQAGFHVGAVPVWVKDKAPLSRGDFNFRYEPIIYGWKKEGKHHWYGDGSDTTVLEYPSIRDSAKDGCGHPSSKPLQLIAYLIRLSSRQKGVVVDTFLGSGTTLIACEQQRRQCYGMEIEPRFVDLCCRRYISYKNAEDDVYLIRDGKRYTWAEANMLSQKGGVR